MKRSAKTANSDFKKPFKNKKRKDENSGKILAAEKLTLFRLSISGII